MISNDDHIDLLIREFLSGNISENDFDELQQFVQQSEEQRAEVRQRMKIAFAENVAHDRQYFDADTACQAFRHRATEKLHKMRLLRVIEVAAAILLLLALPFVGYRYGRHNLEQQFAQTVIRVPDGSQLETTLPDGTHVRLNSGSVMSYSQGFGISSRQIELDGEATFNVRHNDKLPLTVHTEGMLISDLGTIFDVCDYHSDSYATVLMRDGLAKVSNETAGSSKTIKKGQWLSLNKRTGEMRVKDNDPLQNSDWLTGRLIFRGADLQAIAGMLERTYGNKVIVEDSVELRGLRFYGEFSTKSQSISDILNALSRTGKFTYTISGHTVTIR